MKISEIISSLETIAPLSLQEDFDNSGVQTGNIEQEATEALLCIDVTEQVVDEAIATGCNLIVSHHPLIFKPLKKLVGRTYIERCVAKACKHDIVIYACHTNLDNAIGGVNYRLAEKIGLTNIKILSPKTDKLLKLSVFVPAANAETLRNALFDAGAGHIGKYDRCSFSAEGLGTFRAGAASNPFVGQKGEDHTEQETRIDVVLPTYLKTAVLKALIKNHPYEEPAFDLYHLENEWEGAGSGAIGELPDPYEEYQFLYNLKTTLGISCLKHSPLRGQPIRKVALCGGSGAFLIPEAIAAGADLFLTGEARYNDFYDVENRILLAVGGHYETEIITKEIFYDVITKKITNFAVRFSKTDSNPVNYI